MKQLSAPPLLRKVTSTPMSSVKQKKDLGRQKNGDYPSAALHSMSPSTLSSSAERKDGE
ncbi:hypothetical protein G9A89_009430 [Geosiphon pyriformis]|nr:hypothetical protein G9A89_009430 [Geosiphon pyriformis]